MIRIKKTILFTSLISFFSCDLDSSKQELIEKELIIGIKKDSFSFNKKSYHVDSFEKELHRTIVNDKKIYNPINLYIDNSTPVDDIHKIKKILLKNDIKKVKIKLFNKLK